MPQTEEEHMENESLLDEEQMEQDEEKHADGEVRVKKYIFRRDLFNKITNFNYND